LVEEIHTLKHVLGGGKQEHDRVTKAKRRSQSNLVHLIQESDDKGSSGTAASKQSIEVRTLHSEQSEVVAKVDYEDDKLFAELAKMDDYYYEWRRDHPNQPIIDGSPMFINQSYCNTNLMRNHTA